MSAHLKRAVRLAAFVLLVTSPALAADPTGLWMTQRGDAKIRIAACGKNAMCGTVNWLREPMDPQTGKPQVDNKNPNPKLQARKIVGLRILSLAPYAAGGWSGRIYNADDGREYDARLSMPGANSIQVRGCAGPFCGTEIWSRTKR